MGNARAELIDALAERIGTSPLTADEIESVLALASAVAHGTGDRTTAPLASFLAGIAAGTAQDRLASLDEIRHYAAGLVPPPQER
jgi:hypothetical protein